MNAEAHNGMESCRLTVQREEPTAGTAQVQQLAALLQPRLSGRAGTFEDKLQRFEGLVLTDERIHSEAPADALHQALIKAIALRGEATYRYAVLRICWRFA